MATKKTFYVVSDNIQTKSKDKARIRAIVNAFKAIGHKAVAGDVSSNEHTKCTKYKKSMGVNDVWVCVVGGVCGGTIADMTGYNASFGDWFKKEKLKKGSLFFIFVSKPEGACIDVATAKKLPRAHDDDFSPGSFHGIPNPVKYLEKKGVTWIQAGTTDRIVELIKTQQWKGAGLGIESTTTKEVKNEYTVTHGFDKSKPFEAYLAIGYSVNSPSITETKYIYIDWQSEVGNKNTRFNNSYGIQWENNKKFVHQIDLLSKIKAVEDPKGVKNDKYFLKKVIFMRDFEDVKDDKSTEEKENLAYDKNDNSSYKMLLYDLGVYTGEVAYMESLGLGGKTLLDAMNTILEKSYYNFDLVYGEDRSQDSLTFSDSTNDNHNTQYVFNEGFDGNVLGVTNVTYAPTSQLMNSSILIYKRKESENSKNMIYTYAKKAKLNEIFRYGEQQKVDNLSEDTGHIEAMQKAYDNLMEYFQPLTTFTIRTVGMPPLKIGEWVETEMINPLLSNEYQVASRKILIDVENRPIIQTEYGLGDIDAKMKIKANLAEQRKAIVRRSIDVTQAVGYDDRITKELWIG